MIGWFYVAVSVEGIDRSTSFIGFGMFASSEGESSEVESSLAEDGGIAGWEIEGV